MAEINLNKILIVNTFGIGDVLHTTPLLTSLSKARPGVVIDFLANRRSASFLCKNENIRQCLVYERDEFVAEYRKSPLKYWSKWGALLNDIKKESYDVVFDMSMNRNLNFFLWLSGIPVRVGFNYKNRGRFLTHQIPFVGFDDKHVADYFLDLLSLIGVEERVRRLTLAVDDDDQQWAKQWLAERQTKKRLIALLPGGGTSWGKNARFRRWLPENFARLADKVIEKSGAQLILMGDPSERALCDEIEQHMTQDALISAGETNITQLSALLRHCSLAISNDGGPLHIAVASGVKTCSIFGPVNPDVYGPYPPEEHMVITKGLSCQPCYRRFRMPNCQHMQCLHTLMIDEVFQKLEMLL